jgi:hypothetical protein
MRKKKTKYAEKLYMIHNTDTKYVQRVNYFSSDCQSSGESCFIKIIHLLRSK